MDITSEIWERFSGQLRGYFLKRVNNPQDAEDLLQETFIKVHTRIGTLRDQDRLTSWVYQIARNTLIDYYRRKQELADLPEALADDPPDLGEDPHAQIASGLREMVACLPEKYSQPLVMTEFEEKTQEQVAQDLGLSLSGAKSRVQRGRALLRQELLDCCHFEFDRRGHILDYVPRPEYCQQCRC